MVAPKNTSPTRRPVVSNSHDARGAPYVSREEPSRYLVPASSRPHGREHHQRHYSATKADADRLSASSRPSGRPKGEYHQAGGYNPRPHTDSRPSVKDDDYSYTGPREQFARDMQARPPPSRDAYPRRERPLSIMEVPSDFKAPPSARRGDMGPPASTRPLERLDRPDDRRLSTRPLYEEPERGDLPSRRHSVRAPAPVVHQLRDEGYASARDDADFRSKPRRERIEEEDPLPKARPREPDRGYEREREYSREPPRETPREVLREPVRDSMREPPREALREPVRESPRDLPREAERDRDRERDNYARDRDRDYDRERERDRPRPHDKVKHADDRREVRSRENSPDRAGMGKGIAAGLGGAAVAGLAGAAFKGSSKPEEGSDSETRKERRHKKHKHRDRADPSPDPRELDHSERRAPPADDRAYDDRLQVATNKRDDSASESYEDENHRHRHRRRKHRDKDGQDPAAPVDARAAPTEVGRPDRELAEGDDVGRSRRRHERGMSRSREPEPEELERRTISPGEDEDDRPRRVLLVEPEERERVKPRGILKAPRTMPFPEDPNPTREGVAPLKDPGKEGGVPTGARWTKISRVLVNPEALEKAHERFEERDDYVIVLRVVTREEIEKFASKTRELRRKYLDMIPTVKEEPDRTIS